MMFWSFFSWMRPAQTPTFQNEEFYHRLFDDRTNHLHDNWSTIQIKKVDHVVFHHRRDDILVMYRHGTSYVKVKHGPFEQDYIMRELYDLHIPFLVLTPTLLETVLSYSVYIMKQIGSTIFFVCIIPLLFRSMLPDLMNPAASRGKGTFDIQTKQATSSLASIPWIGSKEVLDECLETVRLLYTPGLQMKGILLEGSPGVGKTLLARKIAHEMNATFISTTGSQFIEVYVGVGAQRVRQLFALAREHSPSIIFIDEIDSIASRMDTRVSSYDEGDSTLNQMLAEMDGFQPSSHMLVIGATNRVSVLDKALLRPGRFDRIIHIPLPDKPSRKELLQFFLHRTQHANVSVTEMDHLVSLTRGFSGADIEHLVKEASIFAHRRHHMSIQFEHLDLAMEKHFLGVLKQTESRSDEEVRRIAIHELGHACIVYHFPDYFRLKKISIRPNYQNTGGYTLYDESPYEDLTTKDFLKKQIMILLGGKVAETLFYGEEKISTGSSHDIAMANEIAQTMITQYGFSEEHPHLSPGTFPLSPDHLQEIHREVNHMLQELFALDRDILQTSYHDNMEHLVQVLIERKSLTGLEFHELMGSCPPK